jgi:hypothetical protein
MTLPSLLAGEPWAGQGAKPPIIRTSAVCGFTEEEFGALPIRTVLEVLDRTLPGLRSQSEFTLASECAVETKPLRRLPHSCNLVGVGQDPSWVEHAIDLFLESLDIDQLNKCDEWNSIELTLRTFLRGSLS